MPHSAQLRNLGLCIPNNQFRARDPKFKSQKIKQPKPNRAKPKKEQITSADEFIFNAKQLTDEYPEGQMLWLESST